MLLPEPMIYDLVIAQLAIINNIAIDCGTKLFHVKPHGALYNMAAKDRNIARAIAAAIFDFDPVIVYLGLSGSVMIDEAKAAGLKTANEVFADRSYQNDGSLTPRTEPNALIKDVELVKQQVRKFAKEQAVITTTGDIISVKADSICIHGDGAYALEFAKATYETPTLALHRQQLGQIRNETWTFGQARSSLAGVAADS